ncbi:MULTISPECIES: hypothetical protein [Inquilinus]|uniref:Cbb3-type cytochrome oxidase assembly protein CcoS n=1 Tax=Inquilinus ginsengisoli TaxID=363840 RepID=A0ABU1JH82_9PROT|nr:hypothetical protein [Inquilinus ginsengisoli]MDR6287971.1 hypothetical protein [Inquilinus ginsengisoli]
MAVITALILWAAIGPSIGVAVGAAFASRHRDDEWDSEAEDVGLPRHGAYPQAPGERVRLDA